MNKRDLLKYLDERIAYWCHNEYHTKDAKLMFKYRDIRLELEDIRKTIDENLD